MKVAYILPSLLKPSGWRTHAAAFLGAICTSVEPILFVSKGDEQAAAELFPGIARFPLPVTQQASLMSWRGRRDLAACSLAIRRGRYPEVDLVHSLEAYPTGLVGTWLARKLDRPHIITTQGTYGVVWHAQTLDRWAYRRVLETSSLVCPGSHGTARLMQTYFGPTLACTRLQPILNGNDFYKRVPESEAVRRVFPALPAVLTVGEIKPRKGQHLSLAAFAKVKAQIPETRYFIAGLYRQNEYFQRLHQFVADHELQDVHFLGAVSDPELRSLYQQASVFLLTPQQEGLHFEGFGLVYLEAGAYGLPVVATRSGGVPDAVQDGVTGFLAEPDDEEGLADALVRLLSDTDLARRMGRANRRWAEMLTWEKCAGEYLHAYQSVIG